MKKIKSIISLFLIILFALACRQKSEEKKPLEVQYTGALRTIMSGNIQSVISLDTLSNKEHLYALDAVENLKGEIQLYNSVSFNSFVIDSSLQIKNDYALKASLIVYAEVKEWESFEIKNCTTKSDLEKQIFKIATKHNVDIIDKPFPFLLEGNVKSLDWYVINWNDGDTIHNHKKHKESGLNGNFQNKDVEIIGFYSTNHKAIFTHHTTNMHIHFKTEDDAIAGHIDDLLLNNSITLKLPK